MISSIPILMMERSRDETAQLMALFQMIPSTYEDKFVKYCVIRRFLNRQYGPETKNQINYKVPFLQALNKYNLMIDKQILTSEDVQDPVKKFVMQAILDKKDWGQLISDNGWSKLFVKKQSTLYCLYERWIIYICDQGFKEQEAAFLILHLTQRQKNKINRFSSNNYITHFEKKFNKWLKKDVSQLQNIYYQIQRNLLISIKLKEPFSKTTERLNLQQILQSPPNFYEVKFIKWIEHLCLKFIDNLPPVRPNIYKDSLTWIHIRIQRYNYEQYQYQENKLQFILNQIFDLEASFTYEIEVSLLKDLRQKNSWRVARKHIQDISFRNGWNFVKKHDKGQVEVNPKIQHTQKIQTFSSLETNQQQIKSNFISEINLYPFKQNQDSQKNQFSKEKVSNFKQQTILEQNSNKCMKNLRNKIQKLKPRIVPLAKNLFQDRDQILSQQYQQNTIKMQNEQFFHNRQSLYKNSSLEIENFAVLPVSDVQQNVIQSKPLCILQNEENQLSEAYSRQSQSKKYVVKDRILQTNTNNKFVLSTEQKLMLSLLEKAHDSLEQFKKKYFSNIPSEKLQKHLAKNKEIIDPIHRSILSLYRCNREQTNKISNKYIKKLTQTILNIEIACKNNKNSNSRLQENEILNSNKPNAIKTFITGFDRLVSSIQEKQATAQL